MIVFPDPHIKNENMFSGRGSWSGAKLFESCVPQANGGEGLKVYGDEPELPSEVVLRYNKVSDRTLAMRLSGISEGKNYLFLGQDVFDILNTLSPIPRFRWAKLPVEFEGEEGKTIGHLYVYDPPYLKGIVDWRCSDTRWTLYNELWNVSVSFAAASYSTTEGHDCLIARTEWRDWYFISKDFYYTLHKAGVYGAKKLYRDPFKTYHNYDYVPSNLMELSDD